MKKKMPYVLSVQANSIILIEYYLCKEKVALDNTQRNELSCCISQTFVTVISTWEKQFKEEKIYFQFLIAEITVHDRLAPLFLGLWWGRTSWQKSMVEKRFSPHSDLRARETDRKGPRGTYPSRAHS
jgi:hypothetical protein